MSKVLPVIEMPKAPVIETPVRLPEKPEHDTDLELIDNLMNKSSTEEEEDDIINVTERDVPDEEEVFDELVAHRVKPVKNSKEPQQAQAQAEQQQQQQEQIQSNEFNPAPKTGKRKYTRKAPMSDKQKEHLAKIRVIAIEKRKAEKERKIKEKEEEVIAKAEKKILLKKEQAEQKEKELEKEQHVHINKINKEPVIQQNGFTKDDLDNAVLSAITQYDTLRKQQKKEKQIVLQKEMKEQKMRETLARAIQPQTQPTNDPWRNLFI